MKGLSLREPSLPLILKLILTMHKIMTSIQNLSLTLSEEEIVLENISQSFFLQRLLCMMVLWEL